MRSRVMDNQCPRECGGVGNAVQVLPPLPSPAAHRYTSLSPVATPDNGEHARTVPVQTATGVVWLA